MSNFGKKLSNYNDVTGATIITSTKNQSVFEKNFEAIQNGEYVGKYKEVETLFPITIQLTKDTFKSLEEISIKYSVDVKSLLRSIVEKEVKCATNTASAQ